MVQLPFHRPDGLPENPTGEESKGQGDDPGKLLEHNLSDVIRSSGLIISQFLEQPASRTCPQLGTCARAGGT
jgi:hypothetical protein